MVAPTNKDVIPRTPSEVEGAVGIRFLAMRSIAPLEKRQGLRIATGINALAMTEEEGKEKEGAKAPSFRICHSEQATKWRAEESVL